MTQAKRRLIAQYAVVGVFLAFFSAGVGIAPSYAEEKGADKALQGLNQAARGGYDGDFSAGGNAPNGGLKDLPTAAGRIIGSILAFVGVIFLILMIYGGFTWMMSRGNDADVKKAKDIIEAAVIGLVVLLSAYAITDFIGQQLF